MRAMRTAGSLLLLAVALMMAMMIALSSCTAPPATEKPAAEKSGDVRVVGNRIPLEYFVASGKGDTDVGPGDDPWETGSYDLALQDAKIENFNVTEYSSVLPREAKEIPIAQAQKTFRHGAVIETIMASVNGVKGNTLVSGVGRIQVRRKRDGFHIGGFAAEYEKVHKEAVTLGEAEQLAKKLLNISLMGEVNRRYTSDEYEVFAETHEINAFKVTKKFGTSLVSLCWISYEVPERSAK